MKEPTAFRYEHDQDTSVARLILDRPEKLNALTFDVYAELRDAFEALNDEEDVRAAVLTGRGEAFCTGGDVKEIIGELLDAPYDELLQFTRLTCDLVRSIRHCRVPVIAALNGTAAGAGAVIAAASDIRIAAESARIAFLFPRVGLSGADMGACWLLPRIVGLGNASELLMTGDFVDAEEAHRIGLYNRVLPDGDAARDEATKLAEKLARGPSRALEITKDSLNREAHMDLEAALESEAQIQAALMLNPNFREANEAFRENREPEFE